MAAAVMLLAGSLALTPALGAGATSQARQVAPPVPRVADGRVSGVVTVAEGRGQDDVVVVAFKGDRAISSAITYASRRAAGPQHGYFVLHLAPGDYELRFWKRGLFDDTKQITVGRGADISLGEVDLATVGTFDADPSVEVLDELCREGKAVPLKVKVPSPSRFWSARGEVAVYEGRRLLQTADLTEKDHGRALVGVAGLDAGKHVLHVVFDGRDGLRTSRSRSMVVHVVPKSRT